MHLTLSPAFRLHRVAAFTAILIACVLASPVAGAQTSADARPVNVIEPARVQSRLEEVQASSDYDETTRSTLLEQYRNALTNIAEARAHAKAAAAYESARASAAEEAREIRAASANQQSRNALDELRFNGDTTARDIEERLSQERAVGLAEAARLTDFEQRLSSENLRQVTARERLSVVRSQAERTASRLAVPPPADQASELSEAKRWAQQTAITAHNAEMRKLEQELLSQPMRIELLEAQRDQAEINLARNQERVRALQQRLAERQRAETQQIVAEFDPESLGADATHPTIQGLIRDNAALADELGSLTDLLAAAAADEQRSVSRLDELRQRYQSTQQKLEVAGVNRVLGRYLGEERRALPELSNYRHESSLREDQIAEAGLRNIRLDQQWRALLDIENYVEDTLGGLTEAERIRLRDPATELAQGRRELLRRARTQNDDYLRVLAEAEARDAQLHALIEEYRGFLAEHLLWVRSKEAMGAADLLQLPSEIADFLSPRRWLDATRVFLHETTRSRLQIVAVLLLLLFRWRLNSLRDRLRSAAAKVGRPSEDRFGKTIEAVGLTLAMTVPWPIFTAITGYQLMNSVEATEASRAVGAGLLQISPLLFFLRAFRLLCTPGGVAEGHFRWSPIGLARLRKQMDVLLFTLLFPAFVTVVNREFQTTELGGALSRFTFLILVGGLIVFLYRLLAPETGIAASLRQRGSATGSLPWARFWVITAIAIPLGLATMAVAGFMYSAGTLLVKLINTMWLLFGLVLMREMIVRWLLVMRRRLSLREALQRREVSREAREKQLTATTVADEAPLTVEQPPLDIAALDTDTRRLVNVTLLITGLLGLSGIWSAILPAVGLLDEVTLWRFVGTVGGQEELQAVTLSNLMLALLVIVATFVGARNLPSLIEIVLRQRQSIASGSRLAFATLTRYAIVVLGSGFVLSMIGVNWSKLQWLVAALGVGIGFGLQEIVANFISGLIILMERPIRVGDVVTVGDTSGTVTRVQIRATTITNWDRQELLVPNKEFITGRVLNWSLSDDIIRIYFTVGIAYGSDVEKALRLMDEVAIKHPNVLDEPAPLVTFEGFGDNALNLGLRCFVPSLNVRLQTVTDLHRAINREFNSANIAIAFPQRDVHLDTTAPLEVRLMQGTKDEKSE